MFRRKVTRAVSPRVKNGRAGRRPEANNLAGVHVCIPSQAWESSQASTDCGRTLRRDLEAADRQPGYV